MFFFLSKIFAFLLSPFTWIGILLVLAFITKKTGRSKKLMIAAFALFYIGGNRFIADEVMRLWELPITQYDQLQPSYEVGIVMGGGIIQEDKNTNRLIFRKNTDRLLQAIHLYKSGTIRHMLLSGGAGDLYERDMKEGALLKKYLVGIGIPDSVILVDSVSDNTHESAVICSSLLKKYPAGTKSLLITSSFHMRRSAACFTRQGVVFDRFTTNKQTGDRKWNLRHLLVPDVSSIFFYQNFFHETIGFIVYKIMGYI